MDLSATELIDAAKQIEAAGEAFYEAALQHIRGRSVREVFTWLMAEEARHAESFETILGAVGRADWRSDEHYVGHLRTMVEGHVFPSPEKGREAASRITTDQQAIDFALGFEHDTVRFLQALRDRVREEDRPLIDRLVDEELGHVKALEELAARR